MTLYILRVLALFFALALLLDQVARADDGERWVLVVRVYVEHPGAGLLYPAATRYYAARDEAQCKRDRAALYDAMTKKGMQFAMTCRPVGMPV